MNPLELEALLRDLKKRGDGLKTVSHPFVSCSCCGAAHEPTNDPWKLCDKCTEAGCSLVSQQERCS